MSVNISRAEPVTLAERIWPAQDANRLVRFLALAVIGSLALTLAAKWKVPFYPVPMTMQTGVVFLIGAAYGARLGVASVLLYLLEGALGLPVFTDTPEKGIGLAYMLGPTGGYLIGFVLAAAVTGWSADKGAMRSPWTAVPVFLAADAVIFACGLGWLSTLVGADKALTFGLYPFVYGEALKVALAAALVTAAWRLIPSGKAQG